MKDKTVTESEGTAGGEGIVAGMRLIGKVLKVMAAEGIRCEEAVVARHPPGGMTRILGMVKDGHAVSFTVMRCKIIAPIRAFAPRRRITCPRTGQDVAGAG